MTRLAVNAVARPNTARRIVLRSLPVRRAISLIESHATKRRMHRAANFSELAGRVGSRLAAPSTPDASSQPGSLRPRYGLLPLTGAAGSALLQNAC